ARAALEQSAELAADGRDPYDSMSALLDAEFQRTFNLGSDPTEPREDDDPSDPYAMTDAAFNRLRGILMMQQRIASTRRQLATARPRRPPPHPPPRAATPPRKDPDPRRNDKKARDLPQPLRAFAKSRLAAAQNPPPPPPSPLPPQQDSG